MLDQLGVGRQRLLGQGAGELQRDDAPGGRVDPQRPQRAVQVAGRIGMIQVEIAVQHGLDGVGPRPELIEAVEREQGRAVVEGRDGAGLEPVNIAAQHRGRIQAGLADREAGLARAGGGQDDHQPSPRGQGAGAGWSGIAPAPRRTSNRREPG